FPADRICAQSVELLLTFTVSLRCQNRVRSGLSLRQARAAFPLRVDAGAQSFARDRRIRYISLRTPATDRDTGNSHCREAADLAARAPSARGGIGNEAIVQVQG